MTTSFAPASRKQKMMLEASTDITVIGGAAGSGKSYIATILRHLRFIDDPNYRGFILRRNESVLSTQGGLFDECIGVYTAFDPRVKYTKRPMVFTFPSGATISLKHYNSDKMSEKYRGLQLSGLTYDEATEAEENHIWTLVSRLRSKAKSKPWLALTCNPNCDSWLLAWVLPYLYPEGHKLAGRPNPEMDGVVRYINNINGKTVFTNSVGEMQDLVEENTGVRPRPIDIMSFTFISANCHDNPPLLKSNPNYLGKLLALPRVEQERLYMGNWFARETSEGLFKREWLGKPLTHVAMDVKSRVRCWDLAASLKTEANPDPDYTVGVLMAKTVDGKFVIEDVYRERRRHGDVIKEIARVAHEDQKMFGDVQVWIPEDGGQAGKVAAAYMIQQLAEMGIGAKKHNVGTKSKLNRFKPFCASAENGSIEMVKAEWNDVYLQELESFDGTRKAGHDDLVDATSDCFNKLAQNKELPSFRLPNLSR